MEPKYGSWVRTGDRGGRTGESAVVVLKSGRTHVIGGSIRFDRLDKTVSRFGMLRACAFRRTVGDEQQQRRVKQREHSVSGYANTRASP